MTELPDDEVFERHADLCQVLCNAKRQKILYVLDDGERTVTDLSETTDIPQPTVSQHLRKMRDKKVVTKRSEGNRSYYTIRDERLIEASMMIREVLFDGIDADQQFGIEL
ncbi:MAG: metalloregulator ArsR/SmtB family transcription factor [Halovenus sp.]